MPYKCFSLSMMKGNCSARKFSVDGYEIPTIFEKKALSASLAATPTIY